MTHFMAYVALVSAGTGLGSSTVTPLARWLISAYDWRTAMLVLGEWTSRFTAENRIALEVLAAMPNELWTPGDCPLCQRGEPLERKIQST